MHYVALRCYLGKLTRITVAKRDKTTKCNKQQEENKGKIRPSGLFTVYKIIIKF